MKGNNGGPRLGRRTDESPRPNCCHQGARKRWIFARETVYALPLHHDLSLLAMYERGDQEAGVDGEDKHPAGRGSVYRGSSIGMDKKYELMRYTCAYLGELHVCVAVHIEHEIKGR